METQSGILKASQKALIEELRDKIENELSNHLTGWIDLTQSIATTQELMFLFQ